MTDDGQLTALWEFDRAALRALDHLDGGARQQLHVPGAHDLHREHQRIADASVQRAMSSSST